MVMRRRAVTPAVAGAIRGELSRGLQRGVAKSRFVLQVRAAARHIAFALQISIAAAEQQAHLLLMNFVKFSGITPEGIDEAGPSFRWLDVVTGPHGVLTPVIRTRALPQSFDSFHTRLLGMLADGGFVVSWPRLRRLMTELRRMSNDNIELFEALVEAGFAKPDRMPVAA